MPNSLRVRLKKCVHKGILKDKDLQRVVIVPKDATNGDVFMHTFPEAPATITWHLETAYADWWNAPYAATDAHWEYIGYSIEHRTTDYRCSACGKIAHDGKQLVCPNCRARMEVD